MANYARYKWIAMCFIFPQILVTLVFFIWPSFSAVVHSFYYSDAFGIHRHFAAFGNFYDLLTSADYGQALWVTFILAALVTLLTMGFGLALAVLVNGRQRGQQLYKTLLLWPYAVAPAVAAILWRYLCHPTLGWVTQILHACGMDFNPLIHAKQALFVVIITASWQQFSYNFLFYYAALKMIPPVLLDAAILDGASPWRRFWQIKLPLLSPTSFFLLTMNLIYAFFDTFGIIQVMTNGGPGLSTTTMMYKVYKDGFVGMDPGGSSAQSVVLMLVVVCLTLLQFRFFEKRVHYK